MFAIETYRKAETLQDAVAMLAEDPGARLLAGGTDVLIKLRECAEGFANLVDIHELAELKGIRREADGTVRVGSGVTFTELMESPLIRACIPLLGEAAASVAGPQIRNVGTLGGNLCNGAVSADTCAPVLALNGWLNILGPQGLRTVPALGFHLGPGKVDLHRGELLLCVDFRPEDWTGWGSCYHKYAMREAMDIATIGCAASLRLEPATPTTISALRLAYAVAAPIPVRCPTAEAVAVGASVTPDALPATLTAIADAVLADVHPRSSWRATQDFRLHIIQTLAKRVVTACLNRCAPPCTPGCDHADHAGHGCDHTGHRDPTDPGCDHADHAADPGEPSC